MPNIDKNDKICLTQLLKETSHESGVKLNVVRSVYNSLVSVLLQNLENGNRINMTGFGSFYVQKHKGHPVQFNKKKSSISDYNVVKFSVAGSVKRKFNKHKINNDITIESDSV